MDCIYNRKPEDRHCDYCSALCKNNPAYEYLKARKKANNYEIPLMKDGLYVKFDLEAQGSNKDGWHIEITNYQEGEE